jgi:hypothetical protein
MSKARIETYGSTIDLLGVDTDGALKKIARSVLSDGVMSAESIVVGTWEPTCTAVLNLDAVTSTANCAYIRVGTHVVIAAYFDVDATAAGVFQFRATLPIASAFSSSNHLIGTCSSVSHTLLRASGETTNDALLVDGTASATTSKAVNVTALYRLI